MVKKSFFPIPNRSLSGGGHTLASFRRFDLEQALEDPLALEILLKTHPLSPAVTDPNYYEEEPLLHAAIRGRVVKSVQLLLEYGWNVNKKNDRGESALIVAIGSGNEEMISLLLQKGADPNMQSKDGKVPLHVAVSYNDPASSLVKLLLKAGANPSLANNSGETPLHWAAMQGFVFYFPDLIAFGADVNQPNLMGETPLHAACQNGRIDAVQFLVENGAYRTRKTIYGMTCADYSSTGELRHFFEVLREKASLQRGSLKQSPPRLKNRL